uniref:Uncharacterized protein n=1 Tax=Candidozyma auris TaxID=498019 RepID=A0A0L0P3A6_CANAR
MYLKNCSSVNKSLNQKGAGTSKEKKKLFLTIHEKRYTAIEVTWYQTLLLSTIQCLVEDHH